MRSRRSHQEEVTDVARRRLELLSAELAELRPTQEDSSGAGPLWTDRAGPREPRSASPFEAPLDSWDDQDGPPASRAAPVLSPQRPSGAGRHAHRSLGATDTALGWVQDRLPPTLQGRGQLSGAHLGVLIAVLAIAVAGTGWWLSRADGDSQLPPVASAPASSAAVSGPPVTSGTGPAGVTPPASSASSAGAGVGTSAASASPTARVVVDVAGKVRRPGIATLPAGARVVDALEAAGGPRRGVALGSLNLARLLTDGEQIVVGVPAVPGVAASAASAPTSGTSGSAGTTVPMVDINTAAQAELEELPGIGPVTAQSILAFRSEHGTFSSVDELLEVSGIGDATLAKVAPYVTL